MLAARRSGAIPPLIPPEDKKTAQSPHGSRHRGRGIVGPSWTLQVPAMREVLREHSPLRQLARISNNLNQLARAANATRRIEVPRRVYRQAQGFGGRNSVMSLP